MQTESGAYKQPRYGVIYTMKSLSQSHFFNLTHQVNHSSSVASFPQPQSTQILNCNQPQCAGFQPSGAHHRPRNLLSTRSVRSYRPSPPKVSTNTYSSSNPNPQLQRLAHIHFIIPGLPNHQHRLSSTQARTQARSQTTSASLFLPWPSNTHPHPSYSH